MSNKEVSLMSKKKIVLIHPESGISSTGGSQLSALELADHLAPYYDVTLLCGAKCSPTSKVLPCLPRGKVKPWLNKPIIGPMLKLLAGNPAMLIEAITSLVPYTLYLLFTKVDLVYPNNDYGGLTIAYIIRKLKKTPVLYTERAGLVSNGVVMRRNLKFKPDHLVVFNKEVQEAVKQVNPEQATSIITNGVNIERFSPTGDKIDFGLTGNIVLAVGSLDRKNHKRMHLAIDAVAKTNNCSLVICGSGVDRDYYNEMGVSLLGETRFKIVSSAFDDMPIMYRSCDVFTLASDNEPFGRVFLEAMACGKPVVAPNDDMRKIIIGEAGILCDVEDADIYAISLEKAAEIEWQDLPVAQADKFTWEKIAVQYKQVIDSMLEQ